MIKKFRYEKDKLKRMEFKDGKIVTHASIGLNELSCGAGFEEIRGDVNESWTFPHDEFHYVIRGKAEITYTSPPLHNKEEKIIVEAGDAYLTPVGTCAKRWKMISTEIFLHLNVVMPRPEMPE